MNPIRVTWVATHPSQYLAPFLRHLTRFCPDLEVTALYASVPTAAQHGRDFNTSVDWGVPLFGGYHSIVMRDSRPDDVFSYDALRGIDVPGVTEALRHTNPDVVLVPGWHSMFLLRAIAAANRLRVPLMYRGDSHLDSSGVGARRVLAHLRARLLLRRFSTGLAVGRRARAYLQSLGMSEDRVFDVSHCVDNDFFQAGVDAARRQRRPAIRREFGLQDDAFTVLFAGKLATHKNVGDLIAAVARVGPGVALHVVGSGPEEARYREAASRAGVPAVFSGFLNQHDLLKAYASADCLVLPSRETWGLVCNEALAAGLPLVVSDAVGSAPDLVEPGVTGEVFQYGNIDDLARAITSVRRLTVSAPELRRTCQGRADRYSFAVAGAALSRACRATLAAIGRSAPPRVIATMQKSVLVSGNEKSVFEILEAVAEHGGAAHCLVNRWDSARVRSGIEAAGATWSYSRHWYPIRRRVRNPVRWAQMAWEVVKCSTDLLTACSRRRATHVIFQDHISLLLHLLAMPVLRLFGVRLVLTVGNATEVGRFYEVLWRFVVNPSVDVMVANSEFTRGTLVQYGASDAKLTWTYQPCSGHAGSITRDPSRIVYVGQLLEGKGLGVLFDAVENLLARGIEVHLDVVGDTDGWLPPALDAFRRALLERAAAGVLHGRVRFLGWRNDVQSILGQAAVHCAPSLPELREAMGRVVIEAKAAGTPSVVFPSGALPEMVHDGVDGVVCRDSTADALSDALERYLRDPVRREEHGRAARKDLERFSRSRWLSVWSGILEFERPRCEARHAAGG